MNKEKKDKEKMNKENMNKEKMNKEKWISIVSAYAVIYTVITLLNSVLYLGSGIYEDPNGNWHELDRAVILLIGIAAFELCTDLPVKPLLFRYMIAYVPSQLLAFGYVWFSGLREELAKTAYRDIWINFTGLFLLLCMAHAVVSTGREKRKAALKSSGRSCNERNCKI